MRKPDPSVRFIVTCLGAAECIVAFEPEGAIHTLSKGDVFTVEVKGPGSGVIELSYEPGGIIICAWSGGDTFAWDKEGNKLQV